MAPAGSRRGSEPPSHSRSRRRARGTGEDAHASRARGAKSGRAARLVARDPAPRPHPTNRQTTSGTLATMRGSARTTTSCPFHSLMLPTSPITRLRSSMPSASTDVFRRLRGRTCAGSSPLSMTRRLACPNAVFQQVGTDGLRDADDGRQPRRQPPGQEREPLVDPAFVDDTRRARQQSRQHPLVARVTELFRCSSAIRSFSRSRRIRRRSRGTA